MRFMSDSRRMGRRSIRAGCVLSIAAVFAVGGLPVSAEPVTLLQEEQDARPYIVHSASLNQKYLENLWSKSRSLPPQLRMFLICSRVVSAFHRCGAFGSIVESDDFASLLHAVLAAVPPLAFVYPSEQYYYYELHTDSGIIYGNLRFTDIADGKLYLAAYRVDEASNRPVDLRFFVLDSAAAGVLTRSLSDDVHLVCSGGSCRIFVVVNPNKLMPPSNDLRRDEQHVTNLIDESGFAFSLVYNSNLDNFIYLLRDDLLPPVAGLCASARDCTMCVCERSGFVFLAECGREHPILIGVRRDDVLRNTPYDGPFDQIPPGLDLKSMLEAAYPYVQLYGGIDREGVFLERPGTRVAISPYQQYSNITIFHNWIERKLAEGVTDAHRWLVVTYENKRHYHRTIGRRDLDPALPESPSHDPGFRAGQDDD